MRDQLIPLHNLREAIYEYHNKHELNLIDEDNYNKSISYLFNQSIQLFCEFYSSVQDKFHLDIQYSSVRFYNVKFRGVHIEVEIPNNS